MLRYVEVAARQVALARRAVRSMLAASSRARSSCLAGEFSVRWTSSLSRYTGAMHNEFTAIFERDGDWFIAYCPEVPGANGQGHTKDEARSSLADAIALVLEDRREDALRGLPADAVHETVTVG